MKKIVIFENDETHRILLKEEYLLGYDTVFAEEEILEAITNLYIKQDVDQSVEIIRQFILNNSDCICFLIDHKLDSQNEKVNSKKLIQIFISASIFNFCILSEHLSRTECASFSSKGIKVLYKIENWEDLEQTHTVEIMKNQLLDCIKNEEWNNLIPICEKQANHIDKSTTNIFYAPVDNLAIGNGDNLFQENNIIINFNPIFLRYFPQDSQTQSALGSIYKEYFENEKNKGLQSRIEEFFAENYADPRFKESDFLSIEKLKRLIIVNKAICRIKLEYIEEVSAPKVGTGFIFQWKDNHYVMTNCHLLNNKVKNASIYFNYETVNWDNVREIKLDIQNVMSNESLDYAVAKVEDIETVSWESFVFDEKITLSNQDKLILCGHPNGGPRRISFGDTDRLVRNTIFYSNPSFFGSSGSPLLNYDLEVIALHKGRSGENIEVREGSIIKDVITDLKSRYEEFR